MPAKSQAQQQFMGMVYRCKTTGECASAAVKKAADSMTEKEAKAFAETKRKGLPEKVSEGKMTFKDFLREGYKILPSIDRERYTEREGLEGPFRARNGKVYYYDKKEGKNYDPDTDMYISHADFAEMDK